MKIQPLFDRILLKPIMQENASKLITPNEDEGNKMQVISLGTANNFTVQKDDIVLINDYSGNKFSINNDTFILIKECDILAVITKEEK